MKLIRKNIFETNSSSTHTLVLLKKEAELPKRIMKENFQGDIVDKVTFDYPNLRVICGTFRDGGRGKRVVPEFDKSKIKKYEYIYDDPDCSHFKTTKLTSVEENASYIFTYLQIAYFNTDKEDKKEDIERILARFHELLLDLELHPIYQMPDIVYKPYDYNYDGHYKDDPKVTAAWLIDVLLEHNDGGFIESLEDVEELLKNKEKFKNYLTNYEIHMKYDG